VRIAVGASGSPLMRDQSLPSPVSPVSSDGLSTPCSTVGANGQHSNSQHSNSNAGSDAAGSPENSRPKRQTAIGLSDGNREGLSR
jgi:hypothetical protein